jgi:hypothetical protein
VLLALVAIVVLGSACGSSIIGAASSTTVASASANSGSTSGASLKGEVAVSFPVVACTTSSGDQLGAEGWKPNLLLAPIPTALVGRVEFYSDGVHTVLGPSGWDCAQNGTSQGATGLVVYPPGTTPPVGAIPSAGSFGVFAIFNSTASRQGIALVCPYFAIPSWQREEANCSGNPPTGEKTSMPTPDVVAVTDPAGVAGTLFGSGGTHQVTGVVIFPQVMPAVSYGNSIEVAAETCSLADGSLCPTIISDFEVREFPVPTSGS